MPHRMFNPDEVARYLHLSRGDVDSLIRSGEIPFETQGTRTLFRKKEVDAWASRRIIGLAEHRLKDYHRTSSKKVAELDRDHAIMPSLIEERFILPDLHSKTKASVLRDMVALAEKTERVSDTKDLLASLQEREELCSTALPGGIALLHPRYHDQYMFSESFIVFGRTIHPIPFSAPDGSRTDLFFLICCQDDRLHLHTLARLCCMCQQTPLLSRLRSEETAGALYEAIIHAEQQVIKAL